MQVIDLIALARGAEGMPVWSQESEDLNVNLLVLGPGDGIAEHRNPELDVLIVGVDGEGSVTIEGEELALRTGQALVIPKGTRRSIRSSGDRFAYLTCHRRRGRLWPSAPSMR